MKSGDTLSSISQQYKVSIQSLKQNNNVDENHIFAGQHLKIDTGISLQEVDLMARLVNAEAGGEPHAGKVAVAKVVLNRANANGFPNTITDVIYEPIKMVMHLLLLQTVELISLLHRKQNGSRRGSHFKRNKF